MNRARLILIATIFHGELIAQENEDIVVSGAGTSSCGTYLSAREISDKSIEAIFGHWIQGFVSGTNVQRSLSGGEAVSLPDLNSMYFYVDKYCRENPLHSVFQASVSLTLELNSSSN